MTILNGDDVSISSDENFSDPEDYVEETPDQELIPLQLSRKPTVDASEDRAIIIDGIPVVPSDRIEKLKDFLNTKFAPYGAINKIHMARDDKGGGVGYAFLVYAEATSAKAAVKNMHNVRLDTKHTFKVNFFTDYEKCLTVQKEFVPPEPEKFHDIGYLKYWRLDKRCRDQFFVIRGYTSSIYWNSPLGAEKAEERQSWTERNLAWSPHGSYLATFHSKGIALWGGQKFEQCQRLVHQNVFLIDFSPDEKHCVTYSLVPRTASNPVPTSGPELLYPNTAGHLRIFDMVSGKLGRSFEVEGLCPNLNACVVASFEIPPQWPLVRWSADGRYFARSQPDIISVYDTQDGYGMLDKKSLKIPGVQDFAWSPADNMLAYWVAETENVPARVVILEIPSRKELTAKNLFNVAGITLHWQASGDYLCVSVQRYGKKKASQGKPVYVNTSMELEIFHLREKQIPVDKVELRVPSILQLQWEPTGPRFAYLAQVSTQPAASSSAGNPATTPGGENITGGSNSKLMVCVQMVQTDRGKVEKLMENDVNKYRINNIQWSPKGQFLTIASLAGTGHVEWWDMHERTMLNSIDDATYTHLAWDPTGRYVATWVSSLKHKHDIELAMWTCVGRPLYKMGGLEMRELLTMAWRPRPPSLLSEVVVKNVKKNMKKYMQKFEVEDKLLLQAANKEFTEKRRRLKMEYCETRERLKRQLEKLQDSPYETTPQFNDEEEVEVVVKVYEASESNTAAKV